MDLRVLVTLGVLTTGFFSWIPRVDRFLVNDVDKSCSDTLGFKARSLLKDWVCVV